MKKAVIVGCEGQDGRLLWQLLERKGYRILGITRSGTKANFARRQTKIKIQNEKDINTCVRVFQPDEIYYLAAYHHSSENLENDLLQLLRRSFSVHVEGFLNVLNAVRLQAPRCRVFYAASSHIFGDVRSVPQNESTPMNPNCAYGLTKAAGRGLCGLYRKQHGLHVSTGILYNHESPLRGPQFISQKIVRAAWAIKQGRQKELVLGNLKAKVDWGYAGDYVEAMYKILQAGQPDDFIVSSGALHSVKEFTQGVFGYLGLDYRQYVRENPALLKKSTGRQFFGDHSKLTRVTGWKPKVGFNKLISMMVQAGAKADA
ncbi:MAG: GDP-mannose 4,6-dehydratase [Candidatus Omnitrophica bacterium]|nr:GDP-mannose 4,6-dehydratase [Candidatus Omnitrophota bacterium]